MSSQAFFVVATSMTVKTDKMHYNARSTFQYKDVRQPSSFNSFLQSKSLGHELHNQNDSSQKYHKKMLGNS